MKWRRTIKIKSHRYVIIVNMAIIGIVTFVVQNVIRIMASVLILIAIRWVIFKRRRMNNRKIIYLDDAIDALKKCHKHCIDPFDSYHIDIEDAEVCLRDLPPAEPE